MIALGWLVACDGPTDSGGNEVAVSDENIVELALAPSFTTLLVAAETDATFEWSSITTDWLGQPFDAATETQTVEFLRAESLGSADLALALVRDDLTQEMVELYGWEKGAGPYASATVSELEDHTPAVKPSQLVAGDPWLLVLRDGDETIRLVVEVDGSETVVSTGEPYAVVDGLSSLLASATLDRAPLPLGDGDTLAWSALGLGSDGGDFDASRATYLAAVPTPGAGPHDWSALSAALADAEPVATGGSTRMDSPALVAAGSPGDQFLVVLDCTHCEPLFPAAMFVVERE